MTNADGNRMFNPAADVPAALRFLAAVFAARGRAHRSGRALTRAAVAALAIAAVALVALWPRVASAQITVTGNYPQRWHGCKTTCDATLGCQATCAGNPGAVQSVRLPRSTDDLAPNAGISRTDCDSDEVWQFAFSIPATASFSYFDIWASGSATSCADVTTRAVTPPGTQVASATCWRVARFTSGQVLNQSVVSVRTSDIVKSIFRLENYDDPAMTTTSQICYPTEDQQPTRFYLHFLLIGNDGLSAATDAATYEAAYDTTYDLMGPLPPTDVTLGAGGNLLIAKWTGTTALDKDFVQYRAYCFPKVGSEGNPPYYGVDSGLFSGDTAVADTAVADTASGDTGTSEASADDGGADAADAADTAVADTATASTTDTGTATLAGCPTLPTGFAANLLPSADIEALRCASSGTISGKMQISPLANGTTYAIAIAAVDKYGNSGLLSNIVCLDPEETRDFFDTYAADGGKGGGGYCAYGAGSRDKALVAVAGLAALALIGRRYARRGGGSR